MVDSVGEEPTVAATPSKPNLIDIDIQTAVATILGENQELKQEILVQISALNANQMETEKLKRQDNIGQVTLFTLNTSC